MSGVVIRVDGVEETPAALGAMDRAPIPDDGYDDYDDYLFNHVLTAPQSSGPPLPPYTAAELEAHYRHIQDWWGE